MATAMHRSEEDESYGAKHDVSLVDVIRKVTPTRSLETRLLTTHASGLSHEAFCRTPSCYDAGRSQSGRESVLQIWTEALFVLLTPMQRSTTSRLFLQLINVEATCYAATLPPRTARRILLQAANAETLWARLAWYLIRTFLSCICRPSNSVRGIHVPLAALSRLNSYRTWLPTSPVISSTVGLTTPKTRKIGNLANKVKTASSIESRGTSVNLCTRL